MVPVFLLYSIKNIDNKLNFVLTAKLPAEDFEEKKKKKSNGGVKNLRAPFLLMMDQCTWIDQI